eukprot:2767113-Karenia_brevis.AAC.1
MPDVANNGSSVNNGLSPTGQNGATNANGNSFEDLLKGSRVFQDLTNKFSGLENKVGTMENT